MLQKLEFKYNSVPVAALRSSTNILLPVRYIDTEMNKQRPETKSMYAAKFSLRFLVNGISMIVFTKTLTFFLLGFDNSVDKTLN